MSRPESETSHSHWKGRLFVAGALAAMGLSLATVGYVANYQSCTQATYADLSGCSFAHGNLKGASFANSNLTNANFSGANLTRANLTGVTLAGADLSGARLGGVVSAGIVGVPKTLPQGWRLAGGTLHPTS